jgi:hypothetical protein
LCTSFCVDMFSFFSTLSRQALYLLSHALSPTCVSITLGSGTAGSYGSSILKHVTFSPAVYEDSNFSTSVSTFVILCPSDDSYPGGSEVTCYYSFIFISLMGNDVEHLFKYLLCICISFLLENYIIKSFGYC